MQDNMPQEQTEATTPPETSPLITHHLPCNPVQSLPSTWTTDAPEYDFPWHPAEDVTELEETLDQAIAHMKKLLRLIGNRSNVDVKKARDFIQQFEI